MEAKKERLRDEQIMGRNPCGPVTCICMMERHLTVRVVSSLHGFNHHVSHKLYITFCTYVDKLQLCASSLYSKYLLEIPSSCSS